MRKVLKDGLGLLVMVGTISLMVVLSSVSRRDNAGKIGRVMPGYLQALMRDSRVAWKCFTLFEVLVASVAVSRLKSQRDKMSFSAAFRSLRASWRAAGKNMKRFAISATCAVEIYEKQEGDVVVLFVPGGGWSHVDDARVWRLLPAHTHFHSFVIVEYKGYPANNGKQMAVDVGDAILWAQERYFDKRIVVLAHSAGAHLVATAALSGKCEKIRALVLCGGVYDLASHRDYEHRRGVSGISALGAAFTDEERKGRLSPMQEAQRLMKEENLLQEKSFPKTVFLLHGRDDRVAPCQASMDFGQALRNLAKAKKWRNFKVQTNIIDKAGHDQYLRDLFIGRPHHDATGESSDPRLVAQLIEKAAFYDNNDASLLIAGCF